MPSPSRTPRLPAALLAALALPFFLVACFEGERGPAGPRGEKGERGEEGLRGLSGFPGANGVSVKAPIFSGFYRVYLSGTTGKENSNFVDSSQFLFFGEAWSWRLYKGRPDSCALASRGTVDYGGGSNGLYYLFTDTAGRTDTYEVANSRYLKRLGDPDLLGCMKCDVRPGAPCRE